MVNGFNFLLIFDLIYVMNKSSHVIFIHVCFFYCWRVHFYSSLLDRQVQFSKRCFKFIILLRIFEKKYPNDGLKIRKAAQLGGFFHKVFCSYRNKVTVPSNL